MFMSSAISPPEVNGFGWNLGQSEYNCLELALTDFGRDPCRSESGRASRNFFCLVSNVRFHRLPVGQISQSLHTVRGSMLRWILPENIFENLPVRGLFLPKRSTFAWTSSRLPTRPRYLRNEHKSGKVMTGYHAYRMLAFLLYHWNQLKVIPLACRLHTLRM